MASEEELVVAFSDIAERFSGLFRRCVGTWVEHGVQACGAVLTPELTSMLELDVYEPFDELMSQDIDAQSDTPLALLRRATAVVNEYCNVSLNQPGNFTEVDEELHECSLRWGAMKAMLHAARHKRSLTSRPSQAVPQGAHQAPLP